MLINVNKFLWGFLPNRSFDNIDYTNGFGFLATLSELYSKKANIDILLYRYLISVRKIKILAVMKNQNFCRKTKNL
jgi:hypothetical protein